MKTRLLIRILLLAGVTILWRVHNRSRKSDAISQPASSPAVTLPIQVQSDVTAAAPDTRPDQTPTQTVAIASTPADLPQKPADSTIHRQTRLPVLVAQPNDSTLAAPEARDALQFVGMDTQAEMVWASAINDPTVPADERHNLIEDLNEDGFPDPHHITPDDLPLVISRMQLIEQLAPNAMDGTNAAAFAEAYKDLNNMLMDPNPK